MAIMTHVADGVGTQKVAGDTGLSIKDAKRFMEVRTV